MKSKFIKVTGLAIVAVLLLTSCSSLYKPESNHGRGQDYSEAEASIETIEGVEDAAFTVDEWYNHGEGGMFASGGLDFYLRVTITDGYRVADHDNFLKLLAETAWSVNNNSPKGSITLEVLGGVDENYSWAEAAKSVYGKVTVRYPYAYINKNMISVSHEVYKKIYGDWPINPTKIDAAGLIEKGELKTVDAVPISEIDFRWHQNIPIYCITVSAERFTLENGEFYTGDITAKFYKKGSHAIVATVVDAYEPLDDEGEPDDNALHSYFLYEVGEKKTDDKDYTVVLTFEAQEGFATNPITLE